MAKEPYGLLGDSLGSKKLRGGWELALSEDLVKHQVHDDAGNRDIHPERISPAGDPAVALEFTSQSKNETRDYQRDDYYRKRGMRDENREIQRT